MFFLNCDIDIDITYSRPFIFFGFYSLPLYKKGLVIGLVRKLSKIFVSETKRSARKHPEGALGIYTTEPDHARNHQKNTPKSKTIDMAIHDKTDFFSSSSQGPRDDFASRNPPSWLGLRTCQGGIPSCIASDCTLFTKEKHLHGPH